MTTVEEAVRTGGDGADTASGGSGRRPHLRRMPRWAVLILVVAVVLLAVAGLTAISVRNQVSTAALDPDNARPAGARAVAQVLRARGVDVDVARSQAELLDLRVDTATTVLVAHPEDLSDGTAARATQHARSAAAFVLLSPSRTLLTGLDPAVGSRPVSAPGVEAGCETELSDSSDTVSRLDRVFSAAPGSSSVDPEYADCFGTDDGAGLMVLARREDRPALVLLGSRETLANETVTEADNAALALRLLGGSGRLVWYVPDPADIAADEDAATDTVVPPVVGPALLVATSAVLALMLWRGRRLGRLVTEPLPVVVRAVETTESRGRMYRKARDRSRALTVLQAATRARLTAYLGLPAGTDPTSVAAAAASVSGRPYAAVLHLLRDATPDGDAALVELANQLATLEKEVRRP